jgi:hypothetical protein
MWRDKVEDKGYHICCVVDKYTDMSINETLLVGSFPALFVNLEGSATLWNALDASYGKASASIHKREISFDGTAVFIWLIGVSVVAFARYFF